MTIDRFKSDWRILTWIIAISALCLMLSSCTEPDSDPNYKGKQLRARKAHQEKLAQFRALERVDPRLAMDKINAQLDADPSSQSLQWFRWYLSLRTGQTVEVLQHQKSDYDKKRSLWLANLHLFCLLRSDSYHKILPMADQMVNDHPYSREAHFLRAWYAMYANHIDRATADIEYLSKDEKSATLSGWKALLKGLTGKTAEAKKAFVDDEPQCKHDPRWHLARTLFYSRLHRTCYGDSGCHDILIAAAADLAACPMNTRALRAERAFRLNSLRSLWPPAEACVLKDIRWIKRTSPVPEHEEFIEKNLDMWYSKKDVPAKFKDAAQRAQIYRNWQSYRDLGFLAAMDGRPKDARRLIQTSIKLNPWQFSSYARLSSLSDDNDVSLNYMNESLKRFPASPDHLAARAIRLKTKNPLEALDDLRKACKKDLTADLFLTCYLELKESIDPKVNLVEEVDKIWGERDDQLDVAIFKAQMLATRKRLAEAEVWARIATEKFPTS
ncbi:MAG: hypothetical protein K2Z81_24145, partial [Cyanobacteria bacterium]|nr:hypothetical protein [Cyanobacteriota bacterium]